MKKYPTFFEKEYIRKLNDSIYKQPINYNITMYGKFQQYLQNELAAIDEAGLYKRERNIA